MVKTYELETAMMHRWEAFVNRLGYTRFRAGIHWPGIALLYSEKHRHYHNLNHIKSCLDLLFTFPKYISRSDFDRIEFAIWFHDIIYDTHSSRNEENSADYARFVMKEIEAGDLLFRAEVVRMIHLTKHGAPDDIALTEAEKLFLDIDLSILGATPEKFEEYDQNIRKEYAWVPEDFYKTKRAEILTQFLDKPFIFNTEYMRERYDNQARSNLNHKIQLLKEGTS